MSISKWDRAAASGTGQKLGLFGAVARWGLLGLMAGCAWTVSGGRAHAADNAAIEALVGDAVDTKSGTYDDLGDAITRFTHNDLKGARLFLKESKDAHKYLPPPELMLAKLLASANQGQAAREELENCVKVHPEDPESYLIFGDQAFAERRFTDADLAFNKAKEANATFSENAKRKRNFQIRALAGLAAVAESRERWDDAKAYLDAWVAIVDPPNASPRDTAAAAPHDRLGRVLFHADKSESHKTKAPDAYKEFKAAVTCDPNSISADISMAQLYEEASMHSDAATFVKRAVNSLPRDSAAKLNTLLAAAHWALETNQPDEAKEYSTAALQADPTSLEAKFLRGVAGRLTRDTETAEKYLQEVFAASPMNFSASNQYAQVLAEQNNKDKRQKALEIARINDKMFGGQNRQGIETAATLGWVLFQMGKVNEADQVMQAIVKTGSPSADSLYYRARCLQDMGKSEDALKYLDAALAISKSFIHHKDAEDMHAMLVKRLGIDTDDSKEHKKPTPDSDKTDSSKTDAGKTDLGKKSDAGK